MLSLPPCSDKRGTNAHFTHVMVSSVAALSRGGWHAPDRRDDAPRAAQPAPKPEARGKTSYDQISPVLLGQVTFADMMAKDKADKAGVMARQKKLLEERYDLAATARREGQDDARQADPGRPDGQAAGRDDLGAAGRDVARRDPRQGPVPQGLSCRCRTRTTRPAACSSRRWRSSSSPRLERFDLDFDLPEHFLPEFPPAIFLTTRPDLGDVSQGKMVTVENFQEIFQRHPQRQGPGRPAAAGHAVPAAAVQRHGRPQDGASPTACRAWPASTATSTATRRRRRTWSATSGRSRTAAGSTRRACAASTSSGCSARSGR